MGRSAKKLAKEETLTDDDFQRTRYGEIAHNILQAATRGAVRKSVGDACPAGCHLYVIFPTKKGVGIPKTLLSEVFPNAEIWDWTPATTLEGNKAVVVDGIASYVQGGKRSATKAELCRLTGIESNPYLNRLLKNLDVQAALLEKGIFITVERGRVVFETAAAQRKKFDG